MATESSKYDARCFLLRTKEHRMDEYSTVLPLATRVVGLGIGALRREHMMREMKVAVLEQQAEERSAAVANERPTGPALRADRLIPGLLGTGERRRPRQGSGQTGCRTLVRPIPLTDIYSPT